MNMLVVIMFSKSIGGGPSLVVYVFKISVQLAHDERGHAPRGSYDIS